jgi:large subunit ribosomal protein L1
MTFHSAVGSREQSLDELTDNAFAIWSRVTGKLERGAGNIRSCYVKTSMGPAIKVVVIE